FNHLIESRRYFRKACEINPSYLAAFRNWQNVTNVLVERWHFRMLNDTLRNETFRKAISKRVDENSTVIDIGTGTGLLRCSLVVTETMDSGLLGEHLLSTLDHAWDRLLLEKESPSVPQVIPSAARLFATPIESSKIARRTKLLPTSQTDFEPLDWTDVKVRPVKYEPYDTENLFANAGHKYLSDPVEIFRFDFNNPKEIKDRLKTNTEERSEVLCTVSGQVDAIAVWFEANLDDELTITTSPLSPVHCNSWHHAVFPCRQPLVVEVGRRLRLVSRCDRGVLQVKLADERPAENAIPLDTSVIQFINCHSYLSMLDKALARILDSRPIESVIDVSHFPHQGLRMAKNSGARLMTVHPNLPGRLAKKLMKRNKIKSDQVFRKSFTDVERMGEAEAEEKYDLLIVHFVEPRGEISQEYIKIFEDISSRLLKPDCVVIPSKTEIWGRLVDSRQLVDENRVTNQCLNEDFHLGELINDFQFPNYCRELLSNLLCHCASPLARSYSTAWQWPIICDFGFAPEPPGPSTKSIRPRSEGKLPMQMNGTNLMRRPWPPQDVRELNLFDTCVEWSTLAINASNHLSTWRYFFYVGKYTVFKITESRSAPEVKVSPTPIVSAPSIDGQALESVSDLRDLGISYDDVFFRAYRLRLISGSARLPLGFKIMVPDVPDSETLLEGARQGTPRDISRYRAKSNSCDGNSAICFCDFSYTHVIVSYVVNFHIGWSNESGNGSRGDRCFWRRGLGTIGKLRRKMVRYQVYQLRRPSEQPIGSTRLPSGAVQSDTFLRRVFPSRDGRSSFRVCVPTVRPGVIINVNLRSSFNVLHLASVTTSASNLAHILYLQLFRELIGANSVLFRALVIVASISRRLAADDIHAASGTDYCHTCAESEELWYFRTATFRLRGWKFFSVTSVLDTIYFQRMVCLLWMPKAKSPLNTFQLTIHHPSNSSRMFQARRRFLLHEVK
ncbi:unnamed protein product, partial [Nesidiocoris tenuis]